MLLAAAAVVVAFLAEFCCCKCFEYPTASLYVTAAAVFSLTMYWCWKWYRKRGSHHFAFVTTVGVDFGLDSLAYCHVCNDKSLFTSFKTRSGFVRGMGSDPPCIRGVGSVPLSLFNQLLQRWETVTIPGVLFVPESPRNLLCVSKLKQLKFVVDLQANVVTREHSQFAVVEENNIFVLRAKQGSISFAANASSKVSEKTKAHIRLGHVSETYLNKLLDTGAAAGLLYQRDEDFIELCVPCAVSKVTRPVFKALNTIRKVGGLVLTDMLGPVSDPSVLDGAIYAVHFTDDFSRYSRVFP